jgi:Uma2 family endonuclease
VVLVFYPDTKTVMVHRSPSDVRILGENDELTIENVLPGFKCRVGEFFEV